MDFNRSLKLADGFTLIELIAGFGIIGLVAVLVTSIYLAHFRLFSNQNTSIEVATQNKLALDEMTNQIRESQTVVASCCGGENTGATVLVLQLWPQDAAGEPFDPGIYDYIVYKRNPDNNSQLIKKVVADASSSRTSGTKIEAIGVSDLQFTYDNANLALAREITVSLTTTGTSGNKTYTTTQTAKAVLRNK